MGRRGREGRKKKEIHPCPASPSFQVRCTANFIQLKLSKGKGIFHYDVSFDPQLDSRNERFLCLNQHVGVVGSSRTFDGNKLFLPTRLDRDVSSQEGTRARDWLRPLIFPTGLLNLRA